MPKIGFCGSVSAGKTTLVKELAKLEEFKNYEVCVERSKYLRDLGIPLNTDSTLKGQCVFAAERASELYKENLLTDRTIIDVIVFTNLAKSIPIHQKLEFRDLYINLLKEYDFIFYTPIIGIPIEDNSVRTTDPIYRNQLDGEIRNLLMNYNQFIPGLKYIPENLTLQQRVEFVKSELEPYL